MDCLTVDWKVLIGGVLMAAGHFLMIFPSFFLLALLCIIMGNGAFKPNISTQVKTAEKLNRQARLSAHAYACRWA
jgi:dipeptide/tripeptide permease